MSLGVPHCLHPSQHPSTATPKTHRTTPPLLVKTTSTTPTTATTPIPKNSRRDRLHSHRHLRGLSTTSPPSPHPHPLPHRPHLAYHSSLPRCTSQSHTARTSSPLASWHSLAHSPMRSEIAPTRSTAPQRLAGPTPRGVEWLLWTPHPLCPNGRGPDRPPNRNSANNSDTTSKKMTIRRQCWYGRDRRPSRAMVYRHTSHTCRR